MPPTLRHYLAMGTILVSLALHGASAQVDSAGCAAAGARLRTTVKGPEYGSALGAVKRWCPSTGPALVAGAWLAPPADSASLFVLAGVSGRYRDERVFRALTAAIQDDGHPRQVRLAATSALITQGFPCIALGSSMTVRDGDSLYTFVSLAHFTHYSIGTKGSALVDGDPGARVIKVFSDLASSSSDVTMRAIAKAVAKELSRPEAKKWYNCTP